MQPLYLLLLAAGLLVFVSLVAGVLSARLGLPFLLVFLVAGMLLGSDGPGGLPFNNAQLSAWVGNAALALILLEGGISTRMRTFRLGLPAALGLASVGVVITAAIVGVVAMATMQVDWRYGLLLGAMVGSTDAAAVFSVLRQSGVRLPERVGAALEMESGLNDPTAVFLTLALIAMIRTDAGPAQVLMLLVKQVGYGVALGMAGAAVVGWLLRKLKAPEDIGGPVALLIVSAGMVVFAVTGMLAGSGFLAVYLFGVRVRALADEASHAAASALDGFAWGAQASMFLLLGLLVSPHQLLLAAGPTLAIAATLMFVARPLAVWLCLAPLRFPRAQRVFIGWVGLRGAVPIVLALFPLMEKLPDSYRFFNLAFAVVLASLLLQGTTLGWAAKWLKVGLPPEPPEPGRGAVQGRLTLDADLRLADVFGFFRLPLPEGGGPTLRDWMGTMLARNEGGGDGQDQAEGEGVAWHGAHFHVSKLRDGRIVRVAVALAPPAAAATT